MFSLTFQNITHVLGQVSALGYSILKCEVDYNTCSVAGLAKVFSAIPDPFELKKKSVRRHITNRHHSCPHISGINSEQLQLVFIFRSYFIWEIWLIMCYDQPYLTELGQINKTNYSLTPCEGIFQFCQALLLQGKQRRICSKISQQIRGKNGPITVDYQLANI